MSGNVAEWENSCSGSNGANDQCLVRGGSFLSSADDAKCAAQRTVDRAPMSGSDLLDVGFRCCQ